MAPCRFEENSPVASASGIYFILLAFIGASIQQATSRSVSSDGLYSLQSWTHEPMFVDEPGWIVAQRTSSEDENDDNFWVTRGRKRRYLHLPRPPTVLDGGVRLLLEDDDEDSWTDRGKKGTIGSILENDPFYVNRGKRGVVSERGAFQTEAANREGFSNAFVELRRGKRDVKRSEVGDMLSQDPYWANRGKKGDISSALGDQFWVNRGKKDLQNLLESGDKFWVNRGKKNDLKTSLNGGDTFWVNRGKKSDVQSLLNSKGDPFWVNRGKKSELQSALNAGDQFWVNRGKKTELQSVLNGNEPFWVNRGKKNELQSLLNNGDQFWVNRGKRGEVQSMLEGGDKFWVNRGKKNEIQSLLNNGDQFWVNRGKKGEVQSLLENGEQFWVNRGKKNEIQSLLGNGDQFWVNRGKKGEVQSMIRSGDQFWANRDKTAGNENKMNNNNGQNSDKPDKPSLIKNFLPTSGSFFWSDSSWNERLKKDPLQTILKPDLFFVNRGKKSSDDTKPEGNINETQPRGKTDEQTKRGLLWEKEQDKALTPLFENAFWLDRGKKTNDRTENLDPFWVTRGKRMEMHNRQRRDVVASTVTTKPSLTSTPSPSQASPRQKRMAKSPRMTASYEKDYPYKKDSDVNSVFTWWKDRNAPVDFQDDDMMGAESPVLRRLGENIAKAEPFWVNRGKKSVAVDEGDFVEDVPEKRGDVVSEIGSDLGPLMQAGETFWVARG